MKHAYESRLPYITILGVFSPMGDRKKGMRRVKDSVAVVQLITAILSCHLAAYH